MKKNACTRSLALVVRAGTNDVGRLWEWLVEGDTDNCAGPGVAGSSGGWEMDQGAGRLRCGGDSRGARACHPLAAALEAGSWLVGVAEVAD